MQILNGRWDESGLVQTARGEVARIEVVLTVKGFATVTNPETDLGWNRGDYRMVGAHTTADYRAWADHYYDWLRGPIYQPATGKFV